MVGKAILWGIIAVAFTGMFINGLSQFNLLEEIFVGLVAMASWLMIFKEMKK